jgi:hypothetical protein
MGRPSKVRSETAAIVIKRFKAPGGPAIPFTNHACREALGRMLVHPLGELRRAHVLDAHSPDRNSMVAGPSRKELALPDVREQSQPRAVWSEP